MINVNSNNGAIMDYKNNINKLTRIGFVPIYFSDDGMFTFMYSNSISSICSIELFDNNSMLIKLVSPYCSNNTFAINFDDIFDDIQSMSEVPVRKLEFADLPLISTKEASEVKADKTIYEYFNITDLNSPLLGNKKHQYFIYASKDRMKKIDLILQERLRKMPDGVKELIGYRGYNDTEFKVYSHFLKSSYR